MLNCRFGQLTSRLSLAVAVSVASCAPDGPILPESVIVMISDGAGVEHWTLAKFARSDLAVAEFPVAGLVDTRGAGHVVTGSAAGGTALATGTRTFFGAVGVGPDTLPRETAMEVAKARGQATGLVTTTWIVDATPMVSIMQQMAALPVDVLMGGGRRIFDVAERRDSVDLRGPMTRQYPYIESASELDALSLDTLTSLLGLFSEGDMARAPDRSPGLTTMMAAALRILDRDPDGFFLMVENEGSDTEAHRNVEPDILVAEMLDFDDAVRLALQYHSEHPQTLVVVTADHETGGISVTHDENRDPIVEYATGSHTGAIVPLFAIGPMAERFGGLKENWQIGQLLLGAVRR